MNIIFTSPSPIASTPRSFSHVQPINQSEPPPINAPIAAPASDVTQIGIPANAPFASDGRSSKCKLPDNRDRKSTRLNSSHVEISYAVFCLKKKTGNNLALQPKNQCDSRRDLVPQLGD